MQNSKSDVAAMVGSAGGSDMSRNSRRVSCSWEYKFWNWKSNALAGEISMKLAGQGLRQLSKRREIPTLCFGFRTYQWHNSHEQTVFLS